MDLKSRIVSPRVIIDEGTPKVPHYYGDTIRKLFFASAFVMLFFMPFFTNYIPVSIKEGLFIVLGISIFSGLTNPRLFWVAVSESIISLLCVFVFGYYAVDAYQKYTSSNLYFWVNELQALLFLASLYFSIKTVRGFLVDHTHESEGGEKNGMSAL
ncbi:MAG TPA: hypothetical protein VG935_02445 [Patescibacteria group bacterium]|nr:hypothetical protein [Patescibacteria group bacterium]